MNEIKQEPTIQELLQRFATITNISVEEAKNLVGAASVEEVLENIKKYNEKKIYEQMPKLNRAQYRALKKKMKGKNISEDSTLSTIADTAKRLTYIDLIEKLRELNTKNEGKKNATNKND